MMCCMLSCVQLQKDLGYDSQVQLSLVVETDYTIDWKGRGGNSGQIDGKRYYVYGGHHEFLFGYI